MKKGSFNKIYKIGNLVIKLDKEKDLFSNTIIKEMDSKKYKKYQKDLNKNGIKTSKIYFYTIFPKTILIEKNIKGDTLQTIIQNEKVSIKDKLILIKKLLLLFQKIENSDVCIDWNLKNFILNNNDLVYIDFVPSLYKEKINKINNPIIDDYKTLYIDKKMQLMSLTNYILQALMYLPKNQLKIIKNEITSYMEEMFKIKFLEFGDSVVLKKTELLNKYMNENMTIQEFDYEYKKINKRK